MVQMKSQGFGSSWKFGQFPAIANADELLAKWNRIREIRSEVTQLLKLNVKLVMLAHPAG